MITTNLQASSWERAKDRRRAVGDVTLWKMTVCVLWHHFIREKKEEVSKVWYRFSRVVSSSCWSDVIRKSTETPSMVASALCGCVGHQMLNSKVSLKSQSELNSCFSTCHIKSVKQDGLSVCVCLHRVRPTPTPAVHQTPMCPWRRIRRQCAERQSDRLRHSSTRPRSVSKTQQR